MMNIFNDTSDKRVSANQETQKGQAIESNAKAIRSLEPLTSDKRVTANRETRKGQAVEDNITTIQASQRRAMVWKGNNIDVVA